MNRLLVLAVALLAVLAPACAPHGRLSDHPAVYLDADLADALGGAEEAAHAWPGVEPRSVEVVSHADALRLAGDRPADAPADSWVVLATHDVDHAGCPWSHDLGSAATTHVADSGSARTCVDVDYLRDHPLESGSAAKRAVAHELGHALGLTFDGAPDPDRAHNPEEGSLMALSYGGDDSPRASDLVALRAR